MTVRLQHQPQRRRQGKSFLHSLLLPAILSQLSDSLSRESCTLLKIIHSHKLLLALSTAAFRLGRQWSFHNNGNAVVCLA